MSRRHHSMMRRIVANYDDGRRLPKASRPNIKRPIETHAATAHESSGQQDIVCALCGVSFVIHDEPTGLNRTRQQLRKSCAIPPNGLFAHFF
ncbi:MAG: hypothetical protein IOC39_03060 [Burkholderia sp.]|uniref:hypothetical protein n=1 Tax=Burkholderia TaxID=32008 RepID=UPI001CA413B2|nr:MULTISPECIES: hypothetical protein [Burkholderia]MBY8603588.1 hypothetical protein [Burkholderia arboris]MCA3776244.1 hypothetical protein [Burkholderia sp.]MCA3790628.1 hypothetical protein [Burkholderia sp.]MCA3790941.1 hypothetical protein [Burkholderia sp.]MCA3799702.1 hypothetical protein [Burkholderia sp.]